MKKSGMTNLHSGLTRKAPAGVDKSMSMKGGSVDKDTTRGSVAPSPKTLGGRCA